MAASMPVRLSTATILRPALRLANGRSSASSALSPVLGRTCSRSALGVRLLDSREAILDTHQLWAFKKNCMHISGW